MNGKKKYIIIFLIFSFFSISFCQENSATQEALVLLQKDSKFTLVIHGGAGTILKKNISDAQEKRYNEKLTEALNIGYAILKNGGTSLDAIVASIKILEDSPLFNAGKGAVLTNTGTVELDASIMDGKTLRAGAVAGVKTIKNPITAARLVMDKSPHVMLAGIGADEYAKENGLEIVRNDYFIDSTQYNHWKQKSPSPTLPKGKGEQKNSNLPDSAKGGNIEKNKVLPFGEDLGGAGSVGTVGAVAVDKYGNLAAATSTGGMMNKRYGRVGDSPIIGAGTYANNKTCAVSCTGHGEYFIRLSVAHAISALMKYKEMTVEQAANELIHKELTELGGTGGLIALDAKGNFTMPFNTKGMYRGYVKEDGKTVVKIYKE